MGSKCSSLARQAIEKKRGDRETGGGGEVTWVTSNPVTGTDGGRSRTFRNSRVRASQQDQAHSGRKDSLQGVFEEGSHEEALEVTAWDGGSP